MNDPVEIKKTGATSWVLAPRLSKKCCAFCDARLDVHQAVRGGICDHPACRKQQAVKWAAQRREAEVADVRQAASDFRARVAPALGVSDPNSLALAIVPNFQRPVIKTAPSRQAEFRAHLLRVVRQAFEEKLDAAGVSALAEELSEAVAATPGFPEGHAACATCRGFCCRTGGTHAYLNATVIRSHLVRHPGLRPAEVIRAFLKKLPAKTFDHSCVYHGRHGCALPREMRASLCNQFQCAGLKELHDTLDTNGPRPVLIVTHDGEKIRRSTLTQPEREKMRTRIIPT